jgi:hypothetical protein
MVGARNKDNKTRSESTVAVRLPDPFLDNITFSAKNLEGLKKKLSGCRMTHDDAGIKDFSNFVKNLKGMTPIKVGDLTFIALRTGGSLFVLTNEHPENLYENPALMEVDLKRRSIIETGSGKSMFVCMINSTELTKIMNASAQSSTVKRVTMDIGPNLYEAVDEGDCSLISMEDFKNKLALCSVILSIDPDFDVQEFSKSIKFLTIFLDEKNKPYYFMTVGEEEELFRLYVSPDDHQSLSATHLSFGSEEFVLVREE